MRKKSGKSFMFLGFGLLMVVMLFSHLGCGSTGGGTEDNQQQGGTNTGGTNSITVPAINELQNVALTEGVQQDVAFTLDLSQSAGSVDSMSIDTQDISDSTNIQIAQLQPGFIESMFAMLISEAEAQLSGTVEIGIGPSSMVDSVCQNGTFYGPYTITILGGTFSVSPSIIEVDPYALNLIKSGPISICARITSPITLTFSIGNISIDTGTSTDNPPPDTSGDCPDISGNWNFNVINVDSTCGPEDSWTTLVTINQSGCSLNTTWHEDTLIYVPGSISNGTVTIGPGDFPDEGGTTTATYTMTISQNGSMTGNESWNWSDSSGYFCYGGTGDLTVTRQSR